MSDLTLYLVTASAASYDDFESAVVYAHSPEDAVHVTQAEIVRPLGQQAPGIWEPPADGSTLTATPVPTVYGAVLGTIKPC